MKYLIIESAIANKQRANAVTVKDDYNSARMVFHQNIFILTVIVMFMKLQILKVILKY